MNLTVTIWAEKRGLNFTDLYMDTGSPDGRIMNADANYSAGFKKMDEAGLTEKVAEQADMNYAFPAKSMEMMRERNEIARSLYIAEESRPIWDLRILMSGGIERFWLELDVNTNIFGIDQAHSLSKISPELFWWLKRANNTARSPADRHCFREV